MAAAFRRLAPRAAVAAAFGLAFFTLLVGSASEVALSASHAVASVLYVAPAGDDAHPCTKAAPCATLQRAYALAKPGSVVELAAGSYLPQRIVDTGRPRAEAVTFRPAPGAVATLAGLALGDPEAGNGPNDVVVEGLTIGPSPVSVFERSERVVLRNLVAPNFYIRGSSFVTVQGGRYGPCLVGSDPQAVPCANSKVDDVEPPYATTDITIDGASFHDYRVVPGSGAHFECLFIRGGDRVRVLRSRFERCEYFNIFVQYSGISAIRDLRIEGNHFSAPYADGVDQLRDTAVELSGRGNVWENPVVSGNTFGGGSLYLNDGTNGGLHNARVERNVFTSVFCEPGVTFAGNAILGKPCGPTDFTKVYGYVLQPGQLVPDGRRAEAIRRAFDLAQSKPLKDVAKALRAARFPAPIGGWTQVSVRKILSDKFYVGGSIGAAGSHPGLVKARTWRSAQRALARSSARS
jgi:Recombinase